MKNTMEGGSCAWLGAPTMNMRGQDQPTSLSMYDIGPPSSQLVVAWSLCCFKTPSRFPLCTCHASNVHLHRLPLTLTLWSILPMTTYTTAHSSSAESQGECTSTCIRKSISCMHPCTCGITYAKVDFTGGTPNSSGRIVCLPHEHCPATMFTTSNHTNPPAAQGSPP